MSSTRSDSVPAFPPGSFTMLAPMQDMTTLPFMRMLARRGAPDFFVTEFLRVNATSQIDDSVAECAEKTLPETGTPLLVQLIGEDVPALVRVADAVLSRYAKTVAGIDINLGCPMPKIVRKNVGGGLLRDLPKVAEILAALRRVCDEHGKLFCPDHCRPALGEVVELTLPHCDPTINLHDNIYLCSGDEVIEELPIDLRGKFF